MLRSNTLGRAFCTPMLFPVGLIVPSVAFFVATCKSVSEILCDELFLVVMENIVLIYIYLQEQSE